MKQEIDNKHSFNNSWLTRISQIPIAFFVHEDYAEFTANK